MLIIKNPTCVLLTVLSLASALNSPLRAAEVKHAHPASDAVSPESATTAQALWGRINADIHGLDGAVKAQSLKEVHPLTESLSALIQSLPAKSADLTPEKQTRTAGQVRNVTKALESLHVAADAGQQKDVQAKHKALTGLIALLKSQYPEAITAGMATTVGDHAHEGTEHSPAAKATMKAEIISKAPFAPGTEISTVLRLTRPDGMPATLADLGEVHTKKIHLLVIDQSVSDYSHEHPTETAIPGEFAFTFRPKNGGRYTIWADLLPLATGRQEYARTEVAVQGDAKPLQEVTNLTSEVDGYRFVLSSDQPFRTGEAALVTVKVSKPDGSPANNLEPLMGAFAHGVGFTGDLGDVLHVHPMGDEPQKETERGGSELQFHLAPARAGFLRFYVQVRIEGKERFAGFGLQVKEGDAPAALTLNTAPLTDADRNFLAKYEEIRAALAADDLLAAQKAAATLSQAGTIAESKTIVIAREAFKDLSAGAVKIAAGKPGFFVLRCPMVKQGDWVQTNDAVANPYMGKQMLRCGAVRK